MKTTSRILIVVIHSTVLMTLTSVLAEDWPQWRGPNRDAKAAEFKAPTTRPKELPQKWKVAVGERVATPALVGDRLYVFSREKDNEVTRCLDAATGEKACTELARIKVADSQTHA